MFNMPGFQQIQPEPRWYFIEKLMYDKNGNLIDASILNKNVPCQSYTSALFLFTKDYCIPAEFLHVPYCPAYRIVECVAGVYPEYTFISGTGLIRNRYIK